MFNWKSNSIPNSISTYTRYPLRLNAQPFVPKPKSHTLTVEERKYDHQKLNVKAKPFIRKKNQPSNSVPSMSSVNDSLLMSSNSMFQQYVPNWYSWSNSNTPIFSLLPSNEYNSREQFNAQDINPYENYMSGWLSETNETLEETTVYDSTSYVWSNDLPKNFAKEVVNSIPCFPYDSTYIKFESCSVCLEKFGPNHEIKIIACGHYYHSECIDTWLIEKLECPICRYSII